MAKLKSAKSKVRPKRTKSRKFWIGFDLGGTKMLACVLDENFEILSTARKSTNGSEGAAKGRKRIIATIEEAMTLAQVAAVDIQGIGVGCPGLVDPTKGLLIDAPNLGWARFPLRKFLGDRFKCPVAVVNDVDAGTFGEYERGAGKGSRSLLGVFPGTGLGAGFVYDGQLVRGKGISCMEIGHVLMPGTHLASTVFGTASLEHLTSRLALAAEGGVACYRGQAQELDRKTAGNLRNMKSKALASSFKAGDEATMVMFGNSVIYLSMGIATVVNLFAPDHITLGGGLVEELPGLYLNLVREQVGRFALPALSKGVKYSIAKLGGNAVAIGSVAYLRKFGPV